MANGQLTQPLFYVGHQSKLESDGKFQRTSECTLLGGGQKYTVAVYKIAQQHMKLGKGSWEL